MSGRETVLWMWVQGLGLNLSGLALLAATGTIFGPVGWTGTAVAVMLKLIGDGQLVRGYWLWQSQQQQLGSQPVRTAATAP
ncbi:MAG: hypothetical protein Q6L60_15500 [Thermostichus sp. HHBFW_bins_43]